MSRQTKTINTSLSLDVYQSIEEIAEQKGVSRSELLRQVLSNYVVQERRWQRIYELGEKRAKELGIKDESDVEQIIHEFRQQNSEMQCKE
jgi:metal-responsive CopG/Arc/MetJ family transcriptional regulator